MTGKLFQKKGKQDWTLHNSEMEVMRVTAKQKPQMHRDQLPMAPFPMPMSVIREKAMQVEKSSGRRRQQHTTHRPTFLGMSTGWTWCGDGQAGHSHHYGSGLHREPTRGRSSSEGGISQMPGKGCRAWND